MTEPNSSRQTRKVVIADHLWDAFEQMSREMGTERDGLINQAMFVFARLNGFLDVGRASRETPKLPLSSRATGTVPPVIARVADAPARVAAFPPPAPAEALVESQDTPRRKSEGAAHELAEFDPFVEVLPGRGTGPVPIEELAGAEPHPEPARAAAAAAPAEELAADAAPGLYVQLGSGEQMRVDKDRFLIGRGKHCDLIIPSGKVSREHAVIVRDAEGFYIEDLGSSNGTWLNKQRIGRSKLQHGQEYFICSEKLRCTVR